VPKAADKTAHIILNLFLQLHAKLELELCNTVVI